MKIEGDPLEEELSISDMLRTIEILQGASIFDSPGYSCAFGCQDIMRPLNEAGNVTERSDKAVGRVFRLGNALVWDVYGGGEAGEGEDGTQGSEKTGQALMILRNQVEWL